ncbi:MAG: hypothetical protein Q4F27_01995 [Desulfovibrionaceae bacterium]|nr:hypothetical protein [Desulfovibrionaceae bacterium]
MALALGIVLELLWLDVLELGNVVSPHAGLAFLLLFPLARHFGLHEPGPLLLPLLLTMLAAHAGAWSERALRGYQNRVVDIVERTPVFSLGRAVWRMAWQRAAVQFLLYSLCYAVLFWITDKLVAGGLLPQLSSLHWYMLFGMALVGVVLSLRNQRACLVLMGCLLFSLCAGLLALQG